MSRLDDEMILISRRVSEQSTILDRIVSESIVLRATSEQLMEWIRAHLRMIKLELDVSNPNEDSSDTSLKTTL